MTTGGTVHCTPAAKSADACPLAATAAALVEVAREPMVVLDSGLRVVAMNAGMRRQLGVELEDVRGRDFCATCIAAGSQAEVCAVLRAALRRRTQDSGRVILSGERELPVCVVPVGVPPLVLLVLRGATPVAHLGKSRTMGTAALTISTAPDSFGRIMAGASNGSSGELCFRHLRHAEQQCPDCPVRELDHAPAAFRTVLGPRAGEVTLVQATRSGETVADVVVCTVRQSVVGDLVRTRVHALASGARLTPQEERVLHQLMTGAQQNHIAQELGITVRTVKFHQANLLQKLGADSRADLTRLLTS
ncbi:MAG: hypothetical protein HY904_20715 [Deltaproteobacteria bacterium]|nr:hypothetical protein [Deltaproteobacteria bacterium]